MKKIILASILLFSATAYSQTNHSWYLGGNAGFNLRSVRQGNTDFKEVSWSASPEIGTFLTDNIQLGLGITATGFDSDYPFNSNNTLQFGGTVYSRYLFNSGSAFRPFLGISTGYLMGRGKLIQPAFPSPLTTDLMTFNVNFSAGFAYYITPRIGIFGSIGMIGYTHTRTATGTMPVNVENNFGFNANTLGNRFTIGMYYTICQGKAKE